MNVSPGNSKGIDMSDNALMVRWVVDNLKAMGFEEIKTQAKNGNDLDYGTQYSKKFTSVTVNLWLNIETLDNIYEMVSNGFFDRFKFAVVA